MEVGGEEGGVDGGLPEKAGGKEGVVDGGLAEMDGGKKGGVDSFYLWRWEGRKEEFMVVYLRR